MTSSGTSTYLQLRIPVTGQGGSLTTRYIVKNEFLAVENILDREDGKARYAMFVNAYNIDREHGGIHGMTPQERWSQLQLLNTPTRNRNRPRSVTHVCN